MNASQLITAAGAGLESLRKRGLVEPQCLLLRLEGSQLYWAWFKFVALPGHPNPGNACKGELPTNAAPGSERRLPARRGGYSHPIELACFRQSAGRVPSFVAENIPQAEALALAKEISLALFGDEITEVEIARRIAPGTMGVAAYELPDCRRVRNGDEGAGDQPLSEIVILRHGRTCWEEFPREGTVDVQPDFEGQKGFIVDEQERRRIDDEAV